MRLILLASLLAIGCTARSAPDAETPAKKDTPEAKKDGEKKDDKKEPPKPPVKGFAAIEDINSEITVLQVLYALGCDSEQLETLGKLSATTMQESPPRKEVKVTDKFRRAQLALRDALGKGDAEDVEKKYAVLEEIRETEDPQFDNVEITDAARKQAPLLLANLGSRQVANYIKGVDDFPDPIEKILFALEESRKLRGAPWKEVRDDVAFQASWLISGLDTKAEEALKAKVIEFLENAAKIDDKDFDAKKPALVKEAKGMIGKLGPTDIVRHYMERVLAETLSNHRLKAALERMQKGK